MRGRLRLPWYGPQSGAIPRRAVKVLGSRKVFKFGRFAERRRVADAA